jgi:diguanylate cyclase (GGDEF)-like protein
VSPSHVPSAANGGESVDEVVVESTASRDARPRTVVGVAGLHRDVVDARGMTAVHDLIDRGLREMRARLGFERIALFAADPAAPGTLHARTVLDAADLAFDAGAPIEAAGAVARAVDARAACRGDDPTADGALLDRLGVSAFAAAPLRGRGADLGVVVADHGASGRPVTDEDVEVLGMLCSALGLAAENVALAAAGEKLSALAEKDDLTGINNRRHLLAEFQREIDRARRYGKPLSLVMVDVDHFKRWNDAHGHHVGDEVLKAVAQIITSVSRDIDVFGRYGGEEFVVVLPETPVDHAMVYAERLRATIEGQGASLSERHPGCALSVSVGVSSMNARGDDADRMIRRADAALYAAKRHGRNRVCVDVASRTPPSSFVDGL